jgi:acetoin utilization protein AcuC
VSTAFVYGPHLQAYNPSDDAERPLRRRLGIGLVQAYGLLDRGDVAVVEPEPADAEQVQLVHAPAYVGAVRRYSADPQLAASWEAGQWGLSPGGDTPATAGMHEAALGVCGAALTAADIIARGRADAAYCPAPAGLHHALANRASGFCVYNDCALAIRALLDGGAERVAYVDVDAHHGDGVQWLFYDDPRVLTVSVHEDGKYIFPGTGGMAERGTGAGLGTSVNVPLPPFTGSQPFLRAVERVVAPAVTRFQPDVLIAHLGADIHHADPLAHLCVDLEALPRLYRLLHDLAATAAGGRYIVLAGGGYNIDLLARAWALQLDELVGAGLSDDLPPEWLARAERETGHAFTARLLQDSEHAIPAEQRERADAAADLVVDEARALVS